VRESYSEENSENTTVPDPDHLMTDLKRVYAQLIREWLTYMEYLRNHYPYLFSLAMRKNPFDVTACVVIKD